MHHTMKTFDIEIILLIAPCVVGAIQCMSKAAGAVHDLRNQTGTRNTGNLRDNQVREQHQWAVQNLKSVEKVSIIQP